MARWSNDPFDPKKHTVDDVQLTESNIQQPCDIQNHYQTTIQTHNAVSVAASGSSTSTVIDCNGFDKIAINAQSDAATSWSADIQWSHDGTSVKGLESGVLANNVTNSKIAVTDVKARYALIKLNNADAGAAHTMSAWAFLKA
jgi:hypothetical protein